MEMAATVKGLSQNQIERRLEERDKDVCLWVTLQREIRALCLQYLERVRAIIPGKVVGQTVK